MITQKVEKELQRVAHHIGFSGKELHLAKGNLTVASRWVDTETGETASEEEVVTINFSQLSDSEEMTQLRQILSQLTEKVWDITDPKKQDEQQTELGIL